MADGWLAGGLSLCMYTDVRVCWLCWCGCCSQCDMGSERTVSKKEGQAFAREHNMLFIEASAKTQDGISQAFDELMQKILDVPELLQDDSAAGSGSNSGSAAMRLDDRSAQRNAAGGGGSCGGFCA